MTQDQAFLIMKTGVNIYLTGSAGSGKTYLLNKYISYLEEHDIPVAVTASTGIAATHMNGMTIHSWSGMGIKEKLDDMELERLEEKKYLWKRFEKARVLIIDEISMLHANQLDMVERICRKFKRNEKPFGGLQVILSGDFFQLPPITKKEDGESGMIYNCNAWQILNPAVCYLEEQHRQEDNALTEILNMIRKNQINFKHHEILKSRIGQTLKNEIRATRLYTHNINVDEINEKELSLIEEEEMTFQMNDNGPENLVSILKKSCLAHEKLKLKIGAEVMCVKNNFEEGYVNGSRGKITGFESSNGNPIVKLYNGKKIILKPEIWAIEEDGKIKASVSQIPLRLAWAITIHKSQGMSLDNAEIDLRSAFGYGMGYVALSRVRSLEGISLVGYSTESLQVNPTVLSLDENLQNQSYQNELLFKKLTKAQQKKLEEDFILSMGGKINKIKIKSKQVIKDTKVPTVQITRGLLEKKKTISQISKERNLTRETIIKHIEEIAKKDGYSSIAHLKPSKQDINAIKKALSKIKTEDKSKLTPIKILLEKEGNNMSFERIRMARLFL